MGFGSRLVERLATYALVAAVAVAVAGVLVGFLAYRVEPYVARQVTLYRYSRISTYDAYFTLKYYEIYGSDRLPVSTNLPVYLSLVEGISVSYSYRVEGATSSGLIRVEVLLKHPDGWFYRYLNLSEDFKEEFSTSYYIDVGDVVRSMERLCAHIGLKPTSFTLQINTYFDHLTEVGTASRRDRGNHTLTFLVDVARNRVQLVGGSPRYSEPVEERATVYEKQYVLGLEVPTLRTASAVTTSAATVAAGALVLLRLSKAGTRPLRSFERRYRDLVVEVESIEGKNPVEVRVADPESLVKLARLEEAPILKVKGAEAPSKYVVVGKNATYYYEEPGSIGEQT